MGRNEIEEGLCDLTNDQWNVYLIYVYILHLNYLGDLKHLNIPAEKKVEQ